MNKFLCITAISLIVTFSCSSKYLGEDNCKILYEKYQNSLMDLHRDSADFFLTKAIECDTNNLQYAIELYGLRKQQGQIEKALEAIRIVRKISNSAEFKVTEELLLHQLHETLDTLAIMEYYLVFQTKCLCKGCSETDFFHYIALNNFFNGKTKALEEIILYKSQNKGDKTLINFIENLILEKDSMSVLIEVFNAK